MALTPRRLPRARQQMAGFMGDPTTSLHTTYPTMRQEFAALARQLPASELYWVAPDMAALAVSSAASLPDVRFAVEDRPAGVGLVVFDGGIGTTTYQGQELPIDALSWGPAEGGMRLWQWVTRDRVEAGLARQGAELAAWLPPLIPTSGAVLPVTADPVDVADLEAETQSAAAVLAAAWHLMDQPSLVDRTEEAPPPKERRALARRDPDAPTGVTLVDLRRAYVPDGADGGEGEKAGRAYRNRWVVSGHWRDQAHGRDRSERKRIWITSHVKGPEGAPLLRSERVNVWRR